jgi:hypothetical protein
VPLLLCKAPAPTALLKCLLGPRRAPCASASGAHECEAFRLVPCRISPPPREAAHGRNPVGVEEADAERIIAMHKDQVAVYVKILATGHKNNSL